MSILWSRDISIQIRKTIWNGQARWYDRVSCYLWHTHITVPITSHIRVPVRNLAFWNSEYNIFSRATNYRCTCVPNTHICLQFQVLGLRILDILGADQWLEDLTIPVFPSVTMPFKWVTKWINKSLKESSYMRIEYWLVEDSSLDDGQEMIPRNNFSLIFSLTPHFGKVKIEKFQNRIGFN